jgi:hypothetical protein
VEEAAESVATADLARELCPLRRVRVWRAETEPAMRPLAVGMVDEDRQHALDLAAVED